MEVKTIFSSKIHENIYVYVFVFFYIYIYIYICSLRFHSK